MLRKIRKQHNKRLLKLMCLSAAMLTANIAPLPAFAATDITTDVTAPKIVYGYEGTVNLNGNVAITVNDGYALCAQGTPHGESTDDAVLNVNSNGTKTVKIVGDIETNSGYITLTLNNKDSYLAGSLIQGDNITLKLNNGSTWYVPVQAADSYTIMNYSGVYSGIHLNLNGGIVDLYHATPTTARETAAGTRTLSLNEHKGTNQQSGTNNTTFVLSSDIANNKADKVILTGNSSSNTNTYYVQVAYDTSQDTDGTYNATGDITVLTTDGATDTVTAKSYTTTKDVAAGLLTKNLTITPTITTNAGVAKLTSVTVLTDTVAGTTAGPAQKMAEAASTTAKGAMSAWRAENNDLLRRMGELRDDEGKAGAWGRLYGGETEIAGSSTINYHGLQMGYDRKIAVQDGKLFTGLALSQMEGDLSYSSGSGDTKSTMFGVYGSYLGKKGHFADLIIKYGRLEKSTQTASGGVAYTADNASDGLNMSLEYGYHKKLKNNWYLEPQIELNYGYIGSSHYTMKMNGASGAYVADDAINSLIGRIGANIGKNTKNGNVYAKLSLAHEFSGDVGTTTSYGSYANHTSTSMKETWLEYGVGFNAKVSKDTNLYGEISKTTSDKVTEKWKGNIGLRHSF